MRKLLKKLGAVISSAALILSSAAVIVSASEPDYSGYYELMRSRWEDTLTGGEGYDRSDPVIAEKIENTSQTAMEYFHSMTDKSTWDTNGTGGYIWSDLDPMTLSSFDRYSSVTSMYKRVREMALAYRIGNESVFGNQELKAAVIDALDWLNRKWYNPDIEQYGNWYQWQIGIPLPLNDILVLMYNELPDGMLESNIAAIDAFPPLPGHVMTGANQIWRCTVMAVRGALGENSEMLEKANSGIKSVLPYVTSGDGFYTDGSFVQHNMYAYTGGYGASLIRNLTPTLQMMSGTPWEVTGESINNLYRWIYDSFEPLYYKGAFMDMVRGREISRQYNTSYHTGQYILEGIIRVSQFAPEEDSVYYKSLVKYMIEESLEVHNFYENTSIQLYLLAKEIADDDTIAPRSGYELFKMYSAMDRAVQHNENYSVGISMHSKRIAAFEKINGENIKGWYTGSGMLYLYNNDLTQFIEDYWCTVDSRRLPGTTVLRGVADLPAEANGKNALGQNSWAGGTGILGLYGTVGMQLQPVDQTLNAKKSYFMFDNEIVALGSDITAEDGDSVETTIENLKLNAAGNNKFIVNGEEKSAQLGYSESISDANWAYIEGNYENSDVGYYFPDTASFNVLRENRTGTWSDVNQAATQKDDTEKNANYLTMYIDHGKTPSGAGYSYVLLPGMSSEETAAYSANPNITVLANNADVQSVKDDTIGVAGANFWNNKETTVYETVDGEQKEYITSNSKASVMVAEKDGKIEISVSDPTQENSGVIGIEVNRSAAKVISKDDRISVIQTSPSVMLAVDVSGLKGQSVSITLEAGSSEDTSKTAPKIVSDNVLTVRSNETAVASVEITGTRPVSLSLSENAPEGVTVDRFGMLVIDGTLAIGTYRFEITAENAYGSDTQSFTLVKRNSTPVAHWSFDEGSGDTFSDSINTGRKTELANGPEWTDDGYKNGAIQFGEPAGSAAPVAVVQTTNDMAFTGGIEIELAVQFDQSPLDRTQLLLEKRAATGATYIPYALRVSSEGKIGLRWNDKWYESDPLDWQSGVWYEIYVRHDGQKIVFERSGVKCGAVPNTEFTTNNNSYFAIGAGRVSSGDYFVGKIDEVVLSTPNEKGGLQITSSDSFTLIPGTADSFNVTVNDSSRSVIFGLYGAPEGVTIDENGVITVDDTVAQDVYNFYITASYTDELDAVQSFILTVGNPIPEVTPSGSVIYWNFNEGAGNIAKTKSTLSSVSSAVDFNAKLNGGTAWVDGFVGYGVHFGAKADSIDVVYTNNYSTPNGIGMDPNSANNKFGGGVEYDFWVNFDVSPIGREQYLISRKNNGGKIPYAIKVTSEGKLAYCWGNEWTEGEALTDWKAGEWYHINITRMKDGTVTLKRDGIVVGTGVNTSAFVNSGGGVGINHTDRSSSSNCFVGILDEFYMGALDGGKEIVLRSKVSFDTDGGNEVAPQYIWLNETAVTPDVPEKLGCEFVGWYTDKGFTHAFDFDTPITEDITLYAKWKVTEKIPEAEAPEGTVTYWNFNEGEGTVAYDRSSSPKDGTIVGGEWTDGFIGSGLRLSKQTDKVSYRVTWAGGSSVGMDPNQGTLLKDGAEYDFWVNFDVSPNEHEQFMIARANPGGNIPYAIRVSEEGRLGYCWNGGWVEGDALEWNAGEWYHINVTRTKDGTVTLKRDGIVVGTGSNTLGFRASDGAIGFNSSDKTTASNFFCGIIDEFYMGNAGGGEKITMRSKVTFDSNGGSAVAPQYVFSDESAFSESPVKEGAEFLGWYTDEECTDEYDFTELVTRDITLYAKWSSSSEPITDIVLDLENIIAGRGYQLNASILPDTSDVSVEWSVKDAADTGADIENGVLTASNSGEFIITATVKDGISAGVDFVKNFTLTAFELGDVNEDGRVDIRDLIRLKKLAADDESADNPLADINNDRIFDALDLAALRRYLMML